MLYPNTYNVGKVRALVLCQSKYQGPNRLFLSRCHILFKTTHKKIPGSQKLIDRTSFTDSTLNPFIQFYWKIHVKVRQKRHFKKSLSSTLGLCQGWNSENLSEIIYSTPQNPKSYISQTQNSINRRKNSRRTHALRVPQINVTTY